MGTGAATHLEMEAAAGGTAIIHLFEGRRRRYPDRGEPAPMLQLWWLAFSWPFPCYPGRRPWPAPLRAFISFINGRAQ